MLNAFQLAYANENGLYKLAFSVLLLAPLSLMLGISPFDVSIYLIDILFIGSMSVRKDFSWLKPSWVKLFLLLWVYMIIRGAFTINPMSSIIESSIFIRFAVFSLALQHWLLKKEAARRALVIAITIASVFAVLDGLLQLMTGTDLFGYTVNINFSEAWRLSAMSGKPNLGAKLSMISLPAVAYLLYSFNNKSLGKLACWAFFLLALLLALFIPLTGERNATLMFFLGLFLLFVFFKPLRPALLMLSLMILFSLSLFFNINPGFKQRILAGAQAIVGVVHADSDLAKAHKNPYFVLLKTDWNFFLENPLFGIGRKQYATYCQEAPANVALIRKISTQCVTNAQNVYFEWLDETGVVGFILFIAIVWALFNQFYLNRHLFLANPIALAALIEIFLRLWPLASTSSFFFSWSGGPFWLMVGWGLSYIPTAIPIAAGGARGITINH